MESRNEVAENEIDRLERGLLVNHVSDEGYESSADDDDEDNEPAVYTASFKEAEENFVKYQTAQWVLYSLLLILAWGIGLFMLLYLPVRRYISRKDIRSRRLFLTPNAIVYKVTRQVPFLCFGVLKREKYVLLHSVADIVVEQGYLQALFGVYSIRIENVGVRRPPSDDLKIHGVANPCAFKKAVMMQLSKTKSKALSRQVSNAALMSPSKSRRHDNLPRAGELAMLQKLEEVGGSVKRVQNLIEDQRFQRLDATN
nr:Alanine--tRNA ligase [Ipomoea batatas]